MLENDKQHKKSNKPIIRRISTRNRNFLNSLNEEMISVVMMRRKPISPKLSINFSIGLTPNEPLIS